VWGGGLIGGFPNGPEGHHMAKKIWRDEAVYLEVG